MTDEGIENYKKEIEQWAEAARLDSKPSNKRICTENKGPAPRHWNILSQKRETGEHCGPR